MPRSDVAIIGVACRFPGEASSPAAFFEMLLQGRDAWAKVPSTRFDAHAFLHPSRERPGTLVSEGGYFLREDVSKWDAPFFAASAIEARAIDPQQRLLLEVAYESLENAGIPIEAISNTEAACFVGGFTHDYKTIVSRDIYAAPQYAITGCAASMLANRISWFFNLRGASVTVDTACSSSMAALHLACETISSGSNKTRCALVGGTSLILDPDDPCGLNALGFLSPDSRCYAFDSRANGYARGDGMCMLVLKHVDDAIRDGDPIRAVIRATGLNQDGRTAGIVLPHQDAQAELILSTYELAGLDPADTQYVELHGTGTKAGDPTELGAVARTIANSRRSSLYCGSVKTQIGHTEGAAGIAGVLKCILALERGVIPPHLNFVKANPRLQLDSWNIILPTVPVPWPRAEIRRCSINNFGFGGANAHAILEDGYNYLRLRGLTPKSLSQHSFCAQETDAKSESKASSDPMIVENSVTQSRIFVLSAPEHEAIARKRHAHASYLQSCSLEHKSSSSVFQNLAYTLSERRSRFQWRHAVVANSIAELLSLWVDDNLKPAKAVATSNIAFVFTGQGAQWYAMGRELLIFDIFRKSIKDSATVLMELGSPWNALHELLNSESDSKVNQVEYAQPLCAVLQIALADLLAYWGVRPHAVVGHSSGEIAAAYVAGALSREHCLKIAYHRGRVSSQLKQLHPHGAMMAVGLSSEDVKPYLGQSGDSAVVACINSPASITLSGDKAALMDLQITFGKQNIFCRLLQVENAYHSPQMLSVAEEYRDSIVDIAPKDKSTTQFYSTVHGHQISVNQLTADYWVDNLCSPVQFVAALDDMLYANKERRNLKSKANAVGILLEIGPHSALAGPIKQFKSVRNELEHLDYQSMLSRGQDATLTALNTVGRLWTRGVCIDLSKVNDANETSSPGKVLVDLPTYCWNHSTSYWHEARASRNHRFPQFPRHDLIGSRTDDHNPLDPMWKNYLRVSELPWLRDHQINGDIVLPAAGMICAVIEAARQIANASDSSENIKGFELRDVCINRPLIFPDLDTGVETLLHLRRRKLGSGGGVGAWHEFAFYSCQGNETVEHACGLVEIQYTREASEVDSGKEHTEEILARQEKWNSKRASCVDKVASLNHYEYWKSQGLSFGRTFRALTSIRQQDSTVVFETTIPDVRSCMPLNCESDLLVHPATLDACLQVMLVTIANLDDAPKQIWIPTAINTIQVSNNIARGHGQVLHGLCESSRSGLREMVGSIMTGNEKFDSLSGITMHGVTFTGLGSTQSLTQDSRSSGQFSSKLCAEPSWKPDLDFLVSTNTRAILGDIVESPPELSRFCSLANKVVEILCRRVLQNLNRVTDSPLPTYLEKYIEWMRKRSGPLQNGHARSPCGPDPQPLHSDNIEDSTIRSFTAMYPFDGKFCLHVFDRLGDIFQQKTTALAVLMAEDNLSKFYRDTFGCSFSTEILRRWFDLKGHKSPHIRVCEVGGGTASMTFPILEQLGGWNGETPRFSQWTFTDISAGWFENAKTLLHDWESRVEYKRLDIEDDPVGQGFEAATYDVVLAVNVLHATKNIKRTLENCRRLLKPGGNLVLGENTNPNDISSFIFGTLPGWWVSEDGREDGPLLLQSEWGEALKEAGFSGLDLKLPNIDQPNTHRMSVLVSTRQEKQGFPKNTVAILTPDDFTTPTGGLASLIHQEFEHLGSAIEIQNLQAAAANAYGKTIISLLEYERPFLEEIQAIQFEQVKHVLLHGAEVLWVTRSDPHEGPGHPAKRMISGLLRCLKMEDASRRLYELHLCRDSIANPESAAHAIFRRISSTWEVKGNSLEEMETVEQNGTFCIPRYIPDKVFNHYLSLEELGAVPEIENLLQPNRPLKLTIGRPGMLDTLHFVDDETPLQPLPDEEVEIETKACALNFLDIMIAMGQIQHPVLGYEASGIIHRVGAKVTTFKPGDSVIYMGLGSMRTLIRSHESCVHALPANLSNEGVAIPIAYATAYQSLIEVARLRKGESVLIHAAAGGLGQALIQIARLLEAEIFCTVGNNAKKQAIIDLGVYPDHIFSSRDLSFANGIKRVTQDRGVDVIVNSLAGEALRKSWDCLAANGRFIEVGKKDILGNNGLDMRPFLNNTLFAGVNLEAMMRADPQKSSRLVSKVLQLFEEGAINPIQPITAHDFTEMESVFRQMQRGVHIGKLVLRITTESRVPVIPRRLIPLNLDPGSTYLLVGGLGGLGRAQAIFMAEHGAKHIAFISRSGDARQETKDFLEKLRERGVDAQPHAGDVSNKAQLKKVLARISTNMPPIRGVIQGAMVLNDGLFHKMTFDQWLTATRPKVQGSWNLHELLPENLDFFIMLSSLAGIIGSISQANYAAGNTFQDALAHYRKAKGLPAHSIDLGLMKGVGYAEEHKEVAANTSSLRLTSIDADQFFHVLRSAIAGTADGEHPLPTQLLVGAGSGGAAQESQAAAVEGDYYWLRTLPHFAYLQQMDVQTTSTTSEQSPSHSSAAQLGRAASMDEATEIVQTILLAKVAKAIVIPVTDIDTSKPVYSYGVDSLVAVELRNWLALEFRSDISIFDLTSSAPIAEVCRKIAGRSQIVLDALKEEVADGG